MLGYSRYDEPYYEEENDFVHVDEVEEMRKAFVDIIRSLYGDGDIEDLDYEVEHLCDLLEIHRPSLPLNVERKAPVFTNKMQMTNALERVANS